jgi:hypothetical protein
METRALVSDRPNQRQPGPYHCNITKAALVRYKWTVVLPGGSDMEIGLGGNR